MKKCLIYLSCLVFLCSSDGPKDQRETYQGYVVLRTEKLSPEQALELSKLELNSSDYDFWKQAEVGRSADIMASASKLKGLEQILEKNGIQYTTMIDDVQRAVQESMYSEASMAKSKGFDWEDYYSHSKINEYLDKMAERFEWVQSLSIGKSFEGRDMKVLQIAKAGPGKPNVWIEAGIHAREWISEAVATFFVEQLLNKPDGSKYLDHLNFYILPCFNPDGYEYSRDRQRMWRKSRSDLEETLCKGVDCNRNFDHHWGESGVSFKECTDVYPGKNPFSEIETRNVRDFLLSLDEAPILAHSLHSYSQLWLYPYGYNYGHYPDNVEELAELGKKASDALFEVHGSVYETINSADLYPASGASDDWYKAILGTRFVYTTELRDTGRYGFLLPPEQIIPCGEEMWAAEKVILDKLLDIAVSQ